MGIKNLSEKSVHGKAFDMHETQIYLLAVGSDLVESRETQGTEGIEEITDTVGSESGGKAVTMTKATWAERQVEFRIQGFQVQCFLISLCGLALLSGWQLHPSSC